MKNIFTLLLIMVFAVPVQSQSRASTNDLPDKLTKQQLEEKDQRVYKSTILNVPLYYKTLAAVYQLDSMKNEYNQGGGNWVFDDLDVMEYNNNDQCISETDYDYDQGSREKDYIYWYDYDADGNFTEEIGASWNNGQWDTSWKAVNSYDVNGQYLGYIEYDYNNGIWEESWKSEYTYDANGFLIEREYFDWENGQWEGYSKRVRTNHSDGRIDFEISYYHNGTVYEYSDSNYYQYNSALQLISDTRYDWDYTSWDESNLTEYTYYSNGDLQERARYYKYSSSSSWDTSYKYVYNYVAPGYVSERIEQDWDYGMWENSYKDEYTYDMNYVYPQITANPYYLDDEFQMYLTEFAYDWDENSGSWEPYDKEFYYWSHTGIGIVEQTMPQQRVYPNPATDYLYIGFNNEQQYTYKLLDVKGSVIMQGDGFAKKQELWVNQLDAGLYFMVIETEYGIGAEKVIIQ
jgi:hypothetical protein